MSPGTVAVHGMNPLVWLKLYDEARCFKTIKADWSWSSPPSPSEKGPEKEEEEDEDEHEKLAGTSPLLPGVTVKRRSVARKKSPCFISMLLWALAEWSEAFVSYIYYYSCPHRPYISYLWRWKVVWFGRRLAACRPIPLINLFSTARLYQMRELLIYINYDPFVSLSLVFNSRCVDIIYISYLTLARTAKTVDFGDHDEQHVHLPFYIY